MRVVESYVEGAWHSAGDGVPVAHAVSGEPVAAVSSAGIDFGAAADHARAVGGPALRAMTFHERAAMLRALGKHLLTGTEALYAESTATGATRADSAIDIEGGIGVLLSYASKGRRELPNSKVLVDGPTEPLSRDHSFAGVHVLTPRHGVAVHVNAFNFPCWGMLEKLAPTLLAGMPAIVKPASVTCYLTESLVRAIIGSGLLPEGSLQLVCGSPGDLLDHLGEQDAVAFTGSAATAAALRAHPGLIRRAVRFNAEADSLNAAILGESALPGTAEFDLFVDAVAAETTVKAGQKCTAVRRAIVPENLASAVCEALAEKLRGVTVGDPALPDTDMGALVSLGHRHEVSAAVAELRGAAEVVIDACDYHGVDPEAGAFMAPTVLVGRDPAAPVIHSVEAFGPVTTVIGCSGVQQAIEYAALGRGSLVATVAAADDDEAAALALGIAAHHGRVHILDAACAESSTGHGSPLPQLVHGGPGRAGGGEELGGMRAVRGCMQRTAVQGSPDKLTAVTGAWVEGSRRAERGHPFKLHFEELQIGDALLTESRTVTIDDIERFADLTGDRFYAHMDEEAAKASPVFEGRVAHGYFVVAAAAGLFVWPDPGPVLANYGLDNLRFAVPTYPGAELRVALTCKEKSLRAGAGYGEVRWDTQVIDSDDQVVAAYDVLTMVACKEAT